MARPKEFQSKNHARIVYAPAVYFRYLKNNGIPISDFFRQAVKAQIEGEYKYKR